MDRSARLSGWLVAAMVGSLLVAVGPSGAQAAAGGSPWPTPFGPQDSGQQLAADGPAHPGVRWSTATLDGEGNPATGGWLPDSNGFAMLDGVGHVLFKGTDAYANEEALLSFDTTTGAFGWASQELLLDQGKGCHPVAPADGAVWGVGEVASRYPHFTTDTKHALRALDPATGAITRTWRPEGDMLCTTVDLTTEGLLVARVREEREVPDPAFGTVLETFDYVVGIDPLTGAETWRYTPSDEACTLGEVRGVAPAGGPANTLYVDLGWCGANGQGKIAALNTTTGTERATLDRAMPEGQLDVMFFTPGTLLGYEDSTEGNGSWLVAVRDDGGSTLSVEWRIAIAGPDDTSGDEPQVGACLHDVCRFGHAMGAPDGTVMVYGNVLKTGVSTPGFARLDLADGSVRWTRSLNELGVTPATNVLSTDRSGRLWFVPADNDFDPDNDYQKVVSLSVDGVLSHDSDGDGTVEHGLGAPRYYTLVPTYHGNGDTTDYDRDGKPDFAPAITTHYVSAIEADGNLYGVAYSFDSNTGANPGFFFSLTDVAPGDDRLDGSTGGGGTGGDPGGDTGGDPGGGPTEDERVTRYAGSDRYQTAALTVRNSFDPGVARVYVATGANFPDALAAAAVAGRDGGPVVLVKRDEVPTDVGFVLEHLAPGAITVVGGPTAVSDAVMQQLADYTTGPVDRVRGTNRYDTAAKLAATFTGQPPVYVATGANFPDALAGTVPAILWQGPILLVTRDSIPSATAAALQSLQPSAITILGGDAVISPAVEQQLHGYTDGSVRRLAGGNRYETAVRVSQDRMGGVPRIYVATGGNFPDALAGGAPAGLEAASLLLVPSIGTVPSVVLDEVSRLDATELVVLGGEGAVSPEVVQQLVARLGG